MTLNASGPLSLGGATTGQSINLELGQAATATASINATNFRTLAGVASGQISISNFYGKSNTIGWFASFGQSTLQTEIFGIGMSSSQVYLRLQDLSIVVQLSTAGAITFQRQGYVTGGTYRYSISVDSSSNYYVIAENTTRQPQVTKYNSSNTLQWSSSWQEDSFNQTRFGVKPAIDSSGNVYVAVQGVLTGCCFEYYPAYRKINSSGTITAGIAFNTGRPQDAGLPVAVGVDSSGNVYGVAQGIYLPAGKTTTFITKSNSSLGFISKVAYYNAVDSMRSDTGVFDTANNVGYTAGAAGALGFILKHNSSLGVAWCYTTSSTGYWSDAAIDSSGNIYVVSVFTLAGSGTRKLKILKLDSGGSIQWARYIGCSTLNMNTTGASISVSGSTLSVAAQLSNGTNVQNRGFVLQVPTSGAGGAGAGTTFTNNARTWTYASYTETLSSLSTIDGANGSVYGASVTALASPTVTLSTPSVTAVTTTI